MPQLLLVPRVTVPSGEKRVCTWVLPRSGPDSSITLAVVKRRLSGSLSITCQRPPTLRMRSTPTPWALISLRTSSAGRRPSPSRVGPLGCRAFWSMYS
ncbi:hypothetical protein D3C77_647160 [compost metagenome]